jgi:hypothetical protein
MPQIDQVQMREPWMVEIYDFTGRLHEVEMAPGDVVYYEVRLTSWLSPAPPRYVI